MPVVGDFNLADNLAKRLAEIDSPEFRAELGKACGAAAIKQLSDEFRKSTDPYGRAWKQPLVKPSKRRGGPSAKPLTDRGTLKNSYSAQPTPDGFAIGTSSTYAAPHQYGAHIAPHSRLNRAVLFDKNGKFVSPTSAKGRKAAAAYWQGSATYANGITIPRRQMIPEKDTGGVGDKWGGALNKAADKTMREHLKTDG